MELATDPKPDFLAVYRTHAEHVVRTARAFGVPASEIDDVVQEIFVVVHRRLADFEGRSSMKTWVTGIVHRVASRHRDRIRAAAARHDSSADADEFPTTDEDASKALERKEAAATFLRLVEQIEDSRRDVFVLAELEGFSAQEIAAALDVNVNTVYSRLRLARDDFEAALGRERAKRGTR